MLHRSFKPTKCKTSLKLAASRLKLMRNKKEVQVKQLKRDLAQLLQSGLERTAIIRVEHVVREEKTMAAYDLLSIYCELIVARLPIIESQKNCPIDLKEAITSVIFASPRCADITEFADVRKHFTAKYGKEFVSAAIELRPESGVSRMLVEKLSAVAPDGQTKIKILTAIAEEHNVEWDPKAFAEKDSKPAEDLLNGPNTFKAASNTYTETPNLQASSSHDQKHYPPANAFDQSLRSSPSDQILASTDTAGTKPTPSTTYSPEVRPSGNEAEKQEVGKSFFPSTNAFPPGGQNWNMEFKDATSAAQAAAESAERASMAARAAAHLATRGGRQYSEESQKLNAHFEKIGEHIAKSSVDSTFYDRNSKLPNEQTERRRSSQSVSSRSGKASISDDSLGNPLEKGYSQTSLSEENAVKANEGVFFAAVMKKQSGEYNTETVSDRDGFKSQKKDLFVEEKITKSSSTISSRSHSSTSSGDYNDPDSSRQKFGNNAGEDPFVGVNRETIDRDSVQTSLPDNDTVVFDEHGSDDDDGFKFDREPEYDEEEAKLYFPSPGRDSPASLSLRADSWDSRDDTIGSFEKSSSQAHVSTDLHSSPQFSESLSESAANKFSISDEHLDGPKSESEDEVSSESEKELKIVSLKGGHRNKGLTHQAYTKEVAEDKSTSRDPTIRYDSDSDLKHKSDSEEDLQHQTLRSRGEPDNRKAKSSLKVKAAYFDDENDDSKEDVPKQTSSSRGRLGSGFSRRTKASPSSSEANSYSGITTELKETRNYYSSAERPSSQNAGSGQRASEQSKSTKLAAAKPLPESKISLREENSKSSAVERPRTPPRKPAKETPSKENSTKKASHVHPKLPDFDTIAAQLQSSRLDRQ